MRMTASWSGSQLTYRIQVCGVRIRPNGELPSDHTQNSNVRHPATQRKPHLPVHRRSACSGVKALRNTSDARRQAAKLCYRFGPLTPSARSANLIAGDGTKNGFPSSEQRTGKNRKRPLDRKSPIQVRIHLPPAVEFANHRSSAKGASFGAAIPAFIPFEVPGSGYILMPLRAALTPRIMPGRGTGALFGASGIARSG